MEDSVVVCDDLVGDEAVNDCQHHGAASLYCIFDGHGGPECSSFSSARIENTVMEEVRALSCSKTSSRRGSANNMMAFSPEQIQLALGTALEKVSTISLLELSWKSPTTDCMMIVFLLGID